MSKLCRVLFIVFVAVCSWVKAENLDKYQVTVSNIDEEFHCIALSNGMICHVVKKEWGKEKLLAVGDKVVFRPEVWHVERKGALQEEGDFRLSFFKDQQETAFFVWVSEESKPVVVNYVADSSVCIKPAGWLFSEERVQVIELSDGSKWKVPQEFLPGVSHFAIDGDRILITPLNTPDRKMFLVNMDRRFYDIDRSRETIGLYRTIGVLPFQEKNSQ